MSSYLETILDVPVSFNNFINDLVKNILLNTGYNINLDFDEKIALEVLLNFSCINHAVNKYINSDEFNIEFGNLHQFNIRSYKDAFLLITQAIVPITNNDIEISRDLDSPIYIVLNKDNISLICYRFKIDELKLRESLLIVYVADGGANELEISYLDSGYKEKWGISIYDDDKTRETNYLKLTNDIQIALSYICYNKIF